MMSGMIPTRPVNAQYGVDQEAYAQRMAREQAAYRDALRQQAMRESNQQAYDNALAARQGVSQDKHAGNYDTSMGESYRIPTKPQSMAPSNQPIARQIPTEAPVDSNTLAESAASNVGEEDGGAIYNFLRPRQGELEAAQNGQRWHYNLENSIMLPMSHWAEAVRKNAALEHQPSSDRQSDPRMYSGDFRVMSNDIQRFITEVNNGNWMDDLNGVDPDNLDSTLRNLKNSKLEQFQSYKDAIQGFRNIYENSDNPSSQYAKSQLKWLDTELDRAMKPFLGDWSKEDRKSMADTMRLKNYANRMWTFFHDNWNPNTGKIEDPDAAQTFQGMMSNLIDYQLKVTTGAGSNLADAAKVRELHSWMSPEDYMKTQSAMKNYQNFLGRVTARSTDTSLNKAVIAYTNAMKLLDSALNVDPKNQDQQQIKDAWKKADIALANVSTHLEKALESGGIAFDNTEDLGAAISAARDGYRAYVDAVTFGASINSKALFNAVNEAIQIGYDTNNELLGHYGRRGMGTFKPFDVSNIPNETNGPSYTIQPSPRFTNEQMLDSQRSAGGNRKVRPIPSSKPKTKPGKPEDEDEYPDWLL